MCKKKGNWRGSDVAIKKLISSEVIAENEFFKEIEIMMKMRPHENVILMKGYCKEPLCIGNQI